MARINRRIIQKNLHDPDNHDGVITHLEPDILEWEVKWALGSITTNKASGGDGIHLHLNRWAISNPERWCYESAAFNMPANLENSPVATELEKPVLNVIRKKSNAKECSNYHTIALISHASKVMLNIQQARLQNSTWTKNFQMYRLDLEKAEGPEMKLPTLVGS